MKAGRSEACLPKGRNWIDSDSLVRIVFAVARRRGLRRADAEDLVQDLRIKLLRMDPDTPVNASWIWLAADHRAIDYGRSLKKLCSALPPAKRRGGPEELSNLLRARIARLPVAFQAIYNLHLSGFSEREVATTMRISRGRVRRVNEWCYRYLAGRVRGTVEAPPPPRIQRRVVPPLR
jgi:DNA-directed RNA polymerase specialized sigma24 family protein